MTWLPRDIVYHRLRYGRDGALTLSELAEQTKLPRRAVEAAVEALRTEGVPVCTGRDGAWLAQSREELLENVSALQRRVMTQYRTVRSMRRTAQRMLPQLTLFNDVS